MLGFQAEGASPLVTGQISRARDGSERDPHRGAREQGRRAGCHARV
jgi:hypothetical protein